MPAAGPRRARLGSTEQTFDAYLRHAHSRPYVLIAALGLFLALFWAVAIAAHFLALPARHTLAAAVTALAAVVASYALRPVVESIVRGNGNG
ncbi:hypothetical protein [Streptomyces goshikiensis]